MLELGDAVPHDAAVHLELALALAESAADAAPRLLAHEVTPHAAKARKKVLKLGELNLKTPLARGGVTAEDVEDECRAVDDLDRVAKGLLEVGLLGGRKLVVEHDYVDVHAPDDAHELLDLARAHEGLRNGRIEALSLAGDHDGVGRVDEARELVERVLEQPVALAGVDADDECALGDGRG